MCNERLQRSVSENICGSNRSSKSSAAPLSLRHCQARQFPADQSCDRGPKPARASIFMMRTLDRMTSQDYSCAMGGGLKVALACVVILSVAYVLISPDWDEMDGVLRSGCPAKARRILSRLSPGPLPVFSTARRYLTTVLAHLALPKPCFSDLLCTRLC